MKKNYFIPTLLVLALFSVGISYVVSETNMEIYSYGLNSKKGIEKFSNDIQFTNYSCSFPTAISDDPVMRSIRGTLFGVEPTYVPGDLVAIPASYKNVPFEMNAREVALQPLMDMISAAREQGLLIGVNSAFRSFERQKSIFENPLNHSEDQEFDRAARPGFSEHQLGTAIDLSAPPRSSSSQIAATYAWLDQNAHNYGFVLSYPKGAEEITGFRYEPWHHRYVGPELAKHFFENQSLFNETLEAFMDHPFVEGESARHSFTGEEILVQLQNESQTKNIIHENFINNVLSEDELNLLLKDSRDKGSVIISRDSGPLIFSVILNDFEIQNRKYDRYQMQGNGPSGKRIFVDQLLLPEFDAQLVVAYGGRLDQSDVLQGHILSNCR